MAIAKAPVKLIPALLLIRYVILLLAVPTVTFCKLAPLNSKVEAVEVPDSVSVPLLVKAPATLKVVLLDPAVISKVAPLAIVAFPVTTKLPVELPRKT